MAPAVIYEISPMGVAMTYGYDTGNISGVKAMPYWLTLFGDFHPENSPDQRFVLSSGHDSLITSILSAGTFVGALGAFPVGDRLGRRWGIIAYLVLFCIGVALQTGGKSLTPFVIGRVFAGLGVGGTSCLVPMYQSECAPKSIRGAIVAAYQLMITVGLLVAACIVYGTKDIASAACYQIPIGLQFIWAAVLGVGLLFLPESPRWLLAQGHNERAQRALSRILSAPVDSAQVHEEYAEIAANLHHERALGSANLGLVPGYLDTFRSGPGKNSLRTWTGIGLQALQQLTGINFIFYYGTTFFQNAGITNPFLITVATNVVNVCMTVPGMWAVDRAGRRPLLLIGAAGMLVSQFIVAAVGDAVATTNLAGQHVLIAFVCIFIAFFAATWGPLAWVVTSEIYPNSIRARCMSLSTASNWLLNFVIGYSTPYLVNKVPGSAGLQSNVFWIWGGCKLLLQNEGCVLCFIFTYFCIPETKGLSLEQVDILYRNSSIINSNAFRKRILDENMHDEDKDAYLAAKGESGKTEHIEKRDLGP
ncbi:BZ3500_MvSof-1268-A1-R1_Chr4-2g07027 [Microbotryum saponariae]|uniref:BZ3500_MvSof-1268-A1-R1_Chr4-2g07027 protein n=1 Tax=Microbotryum saponariae TaxID=289078 RepID=A0A2X0NG69_9BASI|nr:BZ3500_MvSof-1268-A1-R1_Chr4-2g07027 [Microbotryum saponariae]SDA06692.1 BZ3501_MvSof-1269-A2-R1_Chr4-2g06738 [Microbotryum saponariae]